MKAIGLLFLVILITRCLAEPPASLEAGGRSWRRAHVDQHLKTAEQVVSVHYTAAPTGAPEHVGPWVSIWATHAKEPSKPVIGNLMGIERLFDASRWQQDEIEYRRDGVERLETRRYIQAWAGPVEYMIWPQDADAMPVLNALLPSLDSFHTLTVRYISAFRWEQDGIAETKAVPEPDRWELRDYGERSQWNEVRLRSANPVKVAFRVEATRFIFGLRDVRREPLGPVRHAVVQLGTEQKVEQMTDHDGWVSTEHPRPVPPEPKREIPKDAKEGEYVLVLTQLPPNERVRAIPKYWVRDGVRYGCTVEFAPPPRK